MATQALQFASRWTGPLATRPQQPYTYQRPLRFGKTTNVADILVIGHRGDPTRYPENTIPSFESGLAQGDGFECDIQKTRGRKKGDLKGGVPVFFHDDYMGPTHTFSPKATVKTNPVNHYTWNQIRQSTFNRRWLEGEIEKRTGNPFRFNPQHTKVKMSQLDELTPILKRPKNKGKKVFIEIKRPDSVARHFTLATHDDLEHDLVDWILDNGFEEQVIPISFNIPALSKVKDIVAEKVKAGVKRAAKIETGLDVFAEGTERPEAVAAVVNLTEVDYYLPHFNVTTQDLVDECDRLGLKVFPWVWQQSSVQETKDFARLVKMGVDGIITNQPAELRQFLDAKIDEQLQNPQPKVRRQKRPSPPTRDQSALVT